MKNIQLILNAILSKNIFEYILVDRKLHVVSASDGVEKYLDRSPQKGDDVLDYLPELVGNEEEVKKIFVKRYCLYTLESVYKNDYYVNISIEYCDQHMAIVLLHNITAVTMAKQNLLQYSNESTLLYNTLQKVVDSQNALLFVTDAEKILFANKKFMDYFNTVDIEGIRKKKLDLYKKFNNGLENYHELFERVNDREEHIKIGEDTFIIQATLIESTHKLFTLTKITKLSNAMEIDPLTGVYRKKYFDLKLERLLKTKRNFALVVVDIDNFKTINDTYGHTIGDEVLREFSSLLKQSIRQDDLIARWGGEEFLLALKMDDLQKAMDRIEALRQTIDDHGFGTVKHVTASFGVAWRNQCECDDAGSLLQRADKALYKAKNDGKNRVVWKKLEKRGEKCII
jgi:diguanylate cyclase (GGDEF)-like protein